MRRNGISEEMARAALNNPEFQRLLQEGLSFEANVQQSAAYNNHTLRDDLEASESGVLRLTVRPAHKTPTDMALEYFEKAAVFTTEHPNLTAATFYGLQTVIGGPLNVLRGMVQEVLIGDQRAAIRQVLKTSIADHLGITDQSDRSDQLKFDIAFASGEFGAGFLFGLGMKVVKDSAQSVAKAIRRNERALQAPTTSSKKRLSPTSDPVNIEPSVGPVRKSQRLANKASPSARKTGAELPNVRPELGRRPQGYIRTNKEFVQDVATRAERKVGGTGRVAGIKKHTYAKKLTDRSKRINGDRGLEAEVSWKNGRELHKGEPTKGSTRLDVRDRNNKVIYDHKFVEKPGTGLRPGQVRKIQDHGPQGDSIVEVNPMKPD